MPESTLVTTAELIVVGAAVFVAAFMQIVAGFGFALLAVPLLIIMKTVFSAAGTPDIAGFLFEHGTLTHAGEEDEEEQTERRDFGPAVVDTTEPRT